MIMHCKWDGKSATPTPYYKPQAEKYLEFGRVYRFEVVEIRSVQSHNHYFACVSTAFANIPESHGGRWLTPTELRKWALCQTAFRDTQEFHCPTHAEAIRMATHFSQMREFSVCEIRDNLVLRYTPHSQSKKKMDDKAFQQSKTAVLEVLSGLIGVPVEDLKHEGGQAA